MGVRNLAMRLVPESAMQTLAPVVLRLRTGRVNRAALP